MLAQKLDAAIASISGGREAEIIGFGELTVILACVFGLPLGAVFGGIVGSRVR